MEAPRLFTTPPEPAIAALTLSEPRAIEGLVRAAWFSGDEQLVNATLQVMATVPSMYWLEVLHEPAPTPRHADLLREHENAIREQSAYAIAEGWT